MENKTVTDRIQELMSGKTDRKFAHEVGIPYSTLKGVLDGSRPSLDKLVAIAQATGVSLDWLATGKEPMRGSNAAALLEPASDQHVCVRRYNVKVSAGHGAFSDRAEVLDHIPFTQEFFTKRVRRNPKDMIIVDAAGDSMAPTIADNDLVMIDTSELYFKDAIYAFSYENAVFVKRIFILPDAIEARSDNRADYPSFIIDSEKMQHVNIIGRVVWVGRTL